MKRPKAPLVFVKWSDHAEADEVDPDEVATTDPHEREAVGWLVYQDHAKVLVAQDWNTGAAKWSGVLVLVRPLVTVKELSVDKLGDK